MSVNNTSDQWVADAITLSIEPVGSNGSIPGKTHVVTLCRTGMKFSQPTRLPENETVTVQLNIGPNREPVKIDALVTNCVECKKSAAGVHYEIQLTFADLKVSTAELLQQHVEYIRNLTSVMKELPYRQSA